MFVTHTILTPPPPPPSCRYELDMSKPYDYMVARMLLSLANKSEGVEFTSIEHALGEVRRINTAFDTMRVILGRWTLSREREHVEPKAPFRLGSDPL